MSNLAASFQATPQIPPMHRYGGTVTSNSELAIHALGDSYLVEGSGSVQRLPGWPKGPPVNLYFVGNPTFVSSPKLLMPGSQNYSFAVGDSAWLLPLGDGVWRVISISRADGIPYLQSGVTSLAPPQGRLTLVSGVDVFTTDQTGITSIWYAPSVGGLVPIFDGTNFASYSFVSGPTDLIGKVIVLGSNWLAATIYDCFIALNGGVPTLCTGPAWSVSTPGSAARGAGAGTTQLAKIGGIQTNAVAMTARSANGTTFAVPANQGTYVGSFLTNGSTGTIDFKFGTAASGGGAAIISVYNPYNQVLQIAKVLDSGVTYTYTLLAYQQARASAGNQATVLLGVSGSAVEAIAWAQATNSAGGIVAAAGVGINSITINSASFQQCGQLPAGASGPATAVYAGSPGAGLHTIVRQESSQATGTTTWYGGTVNGIQPGLEVKLLN